MGLHGELFKGIFYGCILFGLACRSDLLCGGIP